NNWEHFAAVVNHLYVNSSPSQTAMRAKQLVAAAHQPNALLADISYCLEGLGPIAAPYLAELLTDPQPEIPFPPPKAGPYPGDAASEETMGHIAQTVGHPFRLDAVQVLADLPPNAIIARALAPCLDSEESQLRVEAYKALAKITDPRIPNPV